MNLRIKEPLKRIVDETLEDLNKFENILKDFGCKVIRAPTEGKSHIFDYKGSVPRSSLQPRDSQLVIDDKLIFTSLDNEGIKHKIEEVVHQDHILVHPEEKRGLTGKNILAAPCITVVNDTIYFDSLHVESKDVEWFKKHFPNHKIQYVTIGGHNDGAFHTIKPGAIISLYDIQNYNKTFPGWDVCYLSDQSWSKIEEFTIFKNKVGGKWYVPGEGTNEKFIEFVNQWLDKWVGYVEETVFDINVLVLDEHHVCISNPNNEKVNAFLKKHNMEPVYVPWRHRYFWDGGLHCITLDLEREGRQQDYFPL